MSKFPRAKIGAGLVVAFLCGLVFASGFDLTRFGWAQGRVTAVSNPGYSSQNLAPLGDIQNGFEGVVDRVKPAVVSIDVEKFATEQPQTNRRQRGGNGGGGNNPCANMDGAPPEMQQFLQQFCGGQGGGQGGAQSSPEQPDEYGSGSGFIVSKDGYILTNNHVVADADKVTVRLVDKREFTAKVIGHDPTTDVAVIKIDANDLPTVVLGDDHTARVGQWALAIGNPLDLDFTVTAGIVSAKGRSPVLPGRSQYSITDYIQTDAAINPGNSGGPLVNVRGEVIGINSAIESETGANIGYGFAVPITLAKEVMDELIKYGHVRRAVIGVAIGEVSPEDAQAAGLKTIGGALVGNYSPDADNASTSPAGRAGIKPGDVIVAAAGQPVDQVSTLQRIIRGFQPGQTVDVDVMRYGQAKSFKITLGEAPSDSAVVSAAPTRQERNPKGTLVPPTAEPKSIDRLGITVAPASAETDMYSSNTPPANFLHGLSVTDIAQRGPNFAKYMNGTLKPTWIITKEISPVERDITSQADLDKALSTIGANGVITLQMAAPSSGTTWTTTPVTLRVK